MIGITIKVKACGLAAPPLEFWGDIIKYSELHIFCFHRCASVVQTGVRSPAFHAAAGADLGEWDEDERSHGHNVTPPLLTLLSSSRLEPKAPPCKCSSPPSGYFSPKPFNNNTLWIGALGLKLYSFFSFVIYKSQWNFSCLRFAFILSACLGLRWVSQRAVKWCLWRSVLKAGRLLAQIGCRHHSSPCPFETSLPWRQSGIHGNTAGHSVILLYYSNYCRSHSGATFGIGLQQSCGHQWFHKERFNIDSYSL